MKNLIQQAVVQCQFQLLDNQAKTKVISFLLRQGQFDRKQMEEKKTIVLSRINLTEIISSFLAENHYSTSDLTDRTNYYTM